MLTFVPDGMKELSDRRMKLALQTEIPDMKAYADEWNKLGADFEAMGAKANAAICFNNWKRYGGGDGQYQRKIEGTFAEVEHKDVLVRIDGQTAIKFPDVDKLAGWLAEVICEQLPVSHAANVADSLADAGPEGNATAS